MRALTRQLRLPLVAETSVDESAYAMYLPRRSTRRLYTVLALVAGVGLGAAYSHFYLQHGNPMWTVSAGVIGAIIGFVLVLMPGVVLRYLRRMSCRFALSRRRRHLQRRLERARSRLNEQVAENPDDAEAWETLGVVELMRQERQRAAQCLERACELCPEAPSTCLNLGAALVETREFDRAIEMLIKAANDETVADAARHNVGVMLTRRPPVGVVDHVLANLEKLESPETLNALGIYAMRRDELELAEDYFSRSAQADPASVAPLANLAVVAHRRGQIEEALERLNDAATLDPLNPAIHNDLGVLLCEAGQPAAAARQLARASFLLPGSGAVEINRGCVRATLGQYEEALDSFNSPLVRDEYPVHAGHNTALALIGEQRYEPALEEIDHALAIAPEDVRLHTNAGCVAWALRDEQRMAAELDRAASGGADDPALATNLAVAWIMKGQVGQAVTMLEALSERHRRNDVVTFHLGLAYLAEAIAGYRPGMSRPERQDFFRSLHRAVRPLEAVAQDAGSGSDEALANIALYRYVRQQFEDAAGAYEQLTQKYPTDGFLQYALGVCLAEQAIALQASHEADGDELVGRARELLARARKHFTRALNLGEQTADIYCNLGMTAYDLGDNEGARQAFRKMLQIEGGDDAANNLAIVYAKEAQRLQHEARSAGLISEERRHDLIEKMRTAISTALHYFHSALELDRDNAVLHGNIGLAYMIRNRENDVESALRHWQHMRRLGGAEEARRYEQLTAMVDSKEGTRAEFDETIMDFRPLDPNRAMTTMPPSLAGLRYAVLPVAEESDWMLVTDDRQVRGAVRLRERVHGLQQRLARLSM